MPAEIGQLYGRAGAVELTKEFLTRPHRDGAARSRQQPVLVFTGPHGSGKTALLDQLEEWLQPVAPYARIDCATDDLSSSPRVLSALVFELNRTAGRYGRLAFPRFITGQLVLRQEPVTDDRARAAARYARHSPSTAISPRYAISWSRSARTPGPCCTMGSRPRSPGPASGTWPNWS